MIRKYTYLHPFQILYTYTGNGFIVYVNKGLVHGYFKPDVVLDVTGAEEFLVEGNAQSYEMSPGQVMFVKVNLSDFSISDRKVIGYPVSASIEIDDDFPSPTSNENGYSVTYYKICEAFDTYVKQFLLSDIWAGYIGTSSESSSSSDSSGSSDESESSSSSSDSSSSSSDDGGGDSSSSEAQSEELGVLNFAGEAGNQYLLLI